MAKLKDLVSKYEEKGNGGDFKKLGWFSLKDDGDTAMVRILHGDDEDLDVFEVHKIEIDGYEQKVQCLGDNCPLCANGNSKSLRTWVQLLNLDEKDKDKQHQIWERGLNDIKALLGLIEENGNLNNRNYKIKRNGKKGSNKTTYQYFNKDKEDMVMPERMKVLGFYVKTLNAKEMEQALRGEFSFKDRKDRDNSLEEDGELPF